jgi:hypothetical protein
MATSSSGSPNMVEQLIWLFSLASGRIPRRYWDEEDLERRERANMSRRSEEAAS